jgi:hypothetical protein
MANHLSFKIVNLLQSNLNKAHPIEAKILRVFIFGLGVNEIEYPWQATKADTLMTSQLIL